MDNYYEIFNIDEKLHGDELQVELRKQQKKLITRQNAADINRRQEAERKLVLVQEAIDVLLDEKKRKEYDQQLNRHDQSEKTDSDQETDSQSHQELIDLASQLIRQKKYPQAMNAAKQALSVNDQSAEAWGLYAYACWAWEEYDKAIQAYKNAINVDPAIDIYYAELASLYYQRGRLSDAREMIDKALYLDPNNKSTRTTEASIYIEIKEYGKAAKIYERLLEEDPDDEEIKTLLASCYEEIGMMYLHYHSPSGKYYSIDQEETKQMINFMHKAHEIKPGAHQKEQISYGEKSLKKKLDFSNWPSIVLAILIGLLLDSLIQTVVLVALVLYVNYVPNYKLNRRELFGEKTKGDRLGLFASGIYKSIKYIVIAIVGFIILMFSVFLG